MGMKKTIYWIVGIAAVTVIGFLLIPQMMRKCSNKIYKYSLKKGEVDFENMGPEIVKKEKSEEE